MRQPPGIAVRVFVYFFVAATAAALLVGAAIFSSIARDNYQHPYTGSYSMLMLLVVPILTGWAPLGLFATWMLWVNQHSACLGSGARARSIGVRVGVRPPGGWVWWLVVRVAVVAVVLSNLWLYEAKISWSAAAFGVLAAVIVAWAVTAMMLVVRINRAVDKAWLAVSHAPLGG